MPTATSAAVLAAIDFSTARSHARHQSLSSTASADSVLEAVVEDPKESAVGPQDSTWASPALASAAQAPVLTYHDGTSGDSIATIASTFHARQEPARKRFKAPFQPHILDRDVGNPKPWMKGRKTISRDKRSYFTTLFGITVGLALGLYSIISGCLDVERDKYDLLLDEQFDGDSLNSSAWRIEQRVGGGESVRCLFAAPLSAQSDFPSLRRTTSRGSPVTTHTSPMAPSGSSQPSQTTRYSRPTTRVPLLFFRPSPRV